MTGQDEQLGGPPLDWRILLGEIFAEAERKGLGRYEPGFTAAPGREDDAAAFIGQRAEHLSEARLNPQPQLRPWTSEDTP